MNTENNELMMSDNGLYYVCVEDKWGIQLSKPGRILHYYRHMIKLLLSTIFI